MPPLVMRMGKAMSLRLVSVAICRNDVTLLPETSGAVSECGGAVFTLYLVWMAGRQV